MLRCGATFDENRSAASDRVLCGRGCAKDLPLIPSLPRRGDDSQESIASDDDTSSACFL
jgi:hypothetical protein